MFTIFSRSGRVSGWLATGWLLWLSVACAAPTPTPTPTAPQPDWPLLNEAIDQVTPVATAAEWSPFDATPDPDGRWVYFTANGAGGPAVLQTAAAGGATTVLAEGAPLAAPWGLTISSDGQTLYVADRGVPDSDAGNVIFALPAAGGTPAPLAGTAGLQPQGVQVVVEAGADRLYFTGVADGEPAVFKLDPQADAAPTLLFQGAPLAAPSGLAVTQAGVIYVADLAAGANETGALLRLQNGAAEMLLDGLRVNPWLAGVALTLDETILLFSNLHRQQGTAQVVALALASNEVFLINKGIGDNIQAGGLHRALRVNQFAWADGPYPPPFATPGQPLPGEGFTAGGGVYFLTTP